jgi:hypothetical protein
MDDICPACGAPLDRPAIKVQLEPGSQESASLETIIDDSHEALILASTRASETAFGISCTLGLLVSLLLLVIVFLAVSKAWTVLAIVVLLSALISVMIANLLASRARSATLQTTYERNVKPEIDRFLEANNLSQQDLVDSAVTRLPEDSPLIAYLTGDGHVGGYP